MADFSRYGLRAPRILLPSPQCDMTKWAVIACDQFTSQEEYWQSAERIVGDAPSTLRMIYPECYLKDGPAPLETIRRTMLDYRKNVLTRVADGFVLVERETRAGTRLGLMAAIDLEQYDFAQGAKPLVRATEGTILSRIPPRVTIRQSAPMELPHVMLLADDPGRTLIEPLREAVMESLYDFDLMLDGGHIRGWRVADEAALTQMERALDALMQKSDGMLFAVGDGNHSLAAARQCWLNLRPSVPEPERDNHPLRYALAEICNLRGDGMAFEPIHRAIFGCNPAELTHDFVLWCRARGMCVVSCHEEQAQLYLLDAPVRIENSVNPLPVAVLQPFLDIWLSAHPRATIDYIHGEDALAEMEARGACCIRLKAMDKGALFEAVRRSGALPRKTFSMGEATDKRYYLECRSLIEE